jgi:hypothetical protein
MGIMNIATHNNHTAPQANHSRRSTRKNRKCNSKYVTGTITNKSRKVSRTYSGVGGPGT